MKYPMIFKLLALGLLASLVGAVVGLLCGMTYGGNYPVPFEYGGLPGYEGAGLFGGMIGAGLAALAATALSTKDAFLRRRLMVLYAGAWCAALVVQHFTTMIDGTGSIAYAAFPMVFTAVIAGSPFLKPEDAKASR